MRTIVADDSIARVMSRILLLIGSLFVILAQGCSSTLSQPFQNLKDQPIYAFRLQPFEPPAAAAGATPASPFPIPPQLQQWMTAGAQYLPPGLLPPGLLPGGTPAQPAASNAPRFHNYVIIQQALVSDKKVHDEILDLLGKESNWEIPRVSCQQYTPEFAFAVGMPPGGAPGAAAPVAAVPAEILVSLSCESVQMFNYSWPYGQKTGITADSAKRIYAIVQNVFGR
jgi:hypothetical protein